MTLVKDFKELFYIVTGEKIDDIPDWLMTKFVLYHLKKAKKNATWFQMFATKRGRIVNNKYAYPRFWLKQLDMVRRIGRKRTRNEGPFSSDIAGLMKRLKVIDDNDI